MDKSPQTYRDEETKHRHHLGFLVCREIVGPSLAVHLILEGWPPFLTLPGLTMSLLSKLTLQLSHMKMKEWKRPMIIWKK